jgi:hypothetical protein
MLKNLPSAKSSLAWEAEHSGFLSPFEVLGIPDISLCLLTSKDSTSNKLLPCYLEIFSQPTAVLVKRI